MIKKTLSGGVIAGGSGSRNRVELDYYATPPYATKMFLDRLDQDNLSLRGSILEPACGGGHMSEVLKEYYGDVVTSTDIVDRGYKGMDAIKNFLEDDFDRYDNVITNPPFKYAQDFIEKSLKISNDKVIMLAKIQLLEGKKRKELFDKNPPNYIYVHSSRVATYRNGDPYDENGKRWATTMCLAWFVWEKNNKNEPIVRWL